jgi:hypothetical protein
MTNSVNLNQLLGDAGTDDNTTQALQLTADTLGPAIMAGLGDVQLDDINTAEVLLVTLLLDDSGSIRFNSNAQVVRDGHNVIIDSLKGAKQSASVLISCRYLNNDYPTNQGVLYPYVMLDTAPLLDSQNYNPNGGTPLHQQTAITLTGVAAKMAEFEQGGVAARAVTVIVTDGADNGPYNPSVQDVNRIVTGLLRTEQHIIAGMGIDDGYTDFRQVFGDMGIPAEWILTPGNSQSEIRRAFQTVSQSAVRASQTAASFSQAALGGFGG